MMNVQRKLDHFPNKNTIFPICTHFSKTKLMGKLSFNIDKHKHEWIVLQMHPKFLYENISDSVEFEN